MRAVGFCIAFAIVAYFLWSAFHRIDAAAIAKLAEPKVLVATVLAALSVALVVPISAWCWKRLLLAQGERWPTLTLARIMGLTQLAKYIPGNVAQHAGRAALSLRAGMSARALLASSTQEIIFAVGASIVVGIAMLAASAPGMTQLPENSRVPLAITGAVFASAMLILGALSLPPNRLAANSSRWMRMLGRLGGLPGPAAALPSLAAYACNYLLIGVGLWGLAYAIGLPSTANYPLVTAAFALSWALGFLTPGMPAGLGVREGIMLLLMKDAAPPDMLLLFVGLARIVTILGDAICFVAANFVAGPDQHSARNPP